MGVTVRTGVERNSPLDYTYTSRKVRRRPWACPWCYFEKGPRPNKPTSEIFSPNPNNQRLPIHGNESPCLKKGEIIDIQAVKVADGRIRGQLPGKCSQREMCHLATKNDAGNCSVCGAKWKCGGWISLISLSKTWAEKTLTR